MCLQVLEIKAAYFENYIYLKIKKLNPFYIKEGDIEIDFFVKDDMLLEINYGGDLNPKQEQLFNNIKVKHKLVINNLEIVLELEKILTNNPMSS